MYTQDWMVVTSVFAFLLGTTMTVACTFLQNDSVDSAIKRQEEQLYKLSQRVEKIHSQYETDMLTILRETLRPPLSQRSVVSDISDDEPTFDNNSIPAGPSGPK